jgi:hypothetical protein
LGGGFCGENGLAGGFCGKGAFRVVEAQEGQKRRGNGRKRCSGQRFREVSSDFQKILIDLRMHDKCIYQA